MKKVTAVLAAAMVAATVSAASAEIKVSGDVYAGPVSKYVFRGLDLSEGKGVIQGGADLSYKNFTLSYWTNYQAVNGNSLNSNGTPNLESGNATETDITLNYSFTPVELLTFNVGNTYYTLDGLNDTNELYLKTTLNTLLSPTLAVYYDWDDATRAGLFYTGSISHTVSPMKDLGITVGALAGYNMENPSADLGANYSCWHHYELSASADYAINENFKITPNYVYSNAFSTNARNVGVTDQSVVGIKATLLF